MVSRIRPLLVLAVATLALFSSWQVLMDDASRAAADAKTAAAPPPLPADYAAQIQKWRTDREARLKADGGWLSVAGLFWLEEGSQPFGSGPGHPIALPSSAPAKAGTLELKDRVVTVRLEPGVTATIGGKPVTAPAVLKPDSSGAPDVLALGPVTLQVIERGGRFAIRMKDNEARARKEFAGLRWFPIKDTHRVVARWEPAAEQRTIPIPNILGTVERLPSPGRAVFQMEGQEVSLSPVIEAPGETQLFFIFSDQTSKKETYGAGRFLYADPPKDGQVVLDFNKAYSPPCAFTAFATCPLPPAVNKLPVRVEAGELRPPGH